MKPSRRPAKYPSKLSDSVHRQLSMYALAASAAGVGMLALAQPAEGKIIYTRANHRIPTNTAFDIDLNHDGIPDIELSFRTTSRTSVSALYSRMLVKGVQQGNQVWEVRSGSHACAAALAKNIGVGPKRPFQPNFLTMFERHQFGGTGSYFGPWFNTTGPRYLGLKFIIKGKAHYAWARVGLATTGHWTLFSYAYETIPNKAIVTGRTMGLNQNGIEARSEALRAPTPEPSTLGMLALGAPGLSIWRREEFVAQEPQAK